MIANLAHVTYVFVESSSSSGDDNGKLGLLFLLAGFLFYGAMYLRYRNVDKRDHYESETKAETANMQAQDAFARSLTHLKNSRMKGANNHSVRGARNGLLSQLPDGLVPKSLSGILPKGLRDR